MKRDSVERKKTVSVCESEEVLVVLAETSQHTSLSSPQTTHRQTKFKRDSVSCQVPHFFHFFFLLFLFFCPGECLPD